MEETTVENVKAIKPINGNTVHKICSGQVVLNLGVAVKELVENSLDAGATSVDVRLKNYGIDLIEVTDNGSGVTEDNFAALTLKYHTSKLNDYSDLLGVSSFGFRGEALSSLCALANLTVTTRHQSSAFATKIEYDHKGNIVKTSLCSRQVGTTVSLTNLFASLPVRQKEFHKNAKREFNKMTQLLYAYCLISIGVKITCSNQTSSSQKSIVVATQGSQSYKDNITCVFGAKQLQTILELKPEFTPNIKENILKGLSGETECIEDSVNIEDVEIDLSEDSNDTAVETSQDILSSQKSPKSQGHTNAVCPVQFSGFISSCAHGSGRSTSDRQFYFVNSRPCEPPKIIKLINEVYRQYNPNQYPFVFLNVNLDRSSVDVNVTPDKRKIFFTKEKIILDVIKSSMMKLFESIPRTLKVESANDLLGKRIEQEVKADLDQPRIFNSFLQRFANQSSKSTEILSNNKSISNTAELKRKSTTIMDFGLTKTRRVINDVEESEAIKSEDKYKSGKANDVESDVVAKNEMEDDTIVSTTIKQDHETNDYFMIKDEISITEHSLSESIENHKNQEIVFLESTDNLPATQIRSIDDIVEKSHKTRCLTKIIKESASPVKANTFKTKTNVIITDKEELGKINRKSVTLKTSLEHVKALTDIYSKQKNKTTPEKVKFRSGINPVFNKKCEEELSREISKESFKKMIVIGQFNLGFIITQLEDDLFIIDQHATDEIYNFETLQKDTELTSQKLVIPQQLELTGVNEQILMDNQSVFKKNGFTFEINEDALPTKRVKLLTLPMSKNWIFGKEDIEELLFMLRESPSEDCRPSRVRAMFASRACRKSVMIGTALSKADMKQLVDHMGEIDKPWNCPHGRPTIRHLVNIAMVHTQESQLKHL